MGKEQTKDLLLDAGKATFLEKGYNNAGIESILQVAGVPKGSFYYYFSSKEDFGLAVIDRFLRSYDEMMDRTLGDVAVAPLDRLRNYFDSVIARIEADGCRKGCLVGKLSQEMADQNEIFRARLEEIFARWVDRYVVCLSEAQQVGDLPADADPRQLAEFCLNAWQGSILRAKTMRNVEPLRTFVAVIFPRVFEAGV